MENEWLCSFTIQVQCGLVTLLRLQSHSRENPLYLQPTTSKQWGTQIVENVLHYVQYTLRTGKHWFQITVKRLLPHFSSEILHLLVSSFAKDKEASFCTLNLIISRNPSRLLNWSKGTNLHKKYFLRKMQTLRPQCCGAPFCCHTTLHRSWCCSTPDITVLCRSMTQQLQLHYLWWPIISSVQTPAQTVTLEISGLSSITDCGIYHSNKHICLYLPFHLSWMLLHMFTNSSLYTWDQRREELCITGRIPSVCLGHHHLKPAATEVCTAQFPENVI